MITNYCLALFGHRTFLNNPRPYSYMASQDHANGQEVLIDHWSPWTQEAAPPQGVPCSERAKTFSFSLVLACEFGQLYLRETLRKDAREPGHLFLPWLMWNARLLLRSKGGRCPRRTNRVNSLLRWGEDWDGTGRPLGRRRSGYTKTPISHSRWAVKKNSVPRGFRAEASEALLARMTNRIINLKQVVSVSQVTSILQVKFGDHVKSSQSFKSIRPINRTSCRFTGSCSDTLCKGRNDGLMSATG